MNDVVRFPTQLCVVPDDILLAPGGGRYLAFHRGRRHLLEAWNQLVASGELTTAELIEIADTFHVVLTQLLALSRHEHPAQPDEPPPSAA